MIKALIVEDSFFMASVLSDLLTDHFSDIEILGISKNGKEGLKNIKQLHPNLVFLDIEMPDMTGFEMLNQLETINFQTIFTTSHSHYAIKAFRFNALDYLVKPINHLELAEALKRFRQNIITTTNENHIQVALKNLITKKHEDQILFLNTQKGSLKIVLKHIVKIKGDGNYSYIYLSNGTKELSSKNLAYFDDVLLNKGFFRCHRSYLVNRYHIDSLKKDSFIMKNDVEVPISRRKKSEAKDWFLKYSG